MNAPRSIDEYLKQLRQALAGQDPALIQDALYDAEEYLRAEVAAHPDKSESDVLELIASTYGAPDEVAAAYRDTEAKVKAALKTPAARAAANASAPARWWTRIGEMLADVRTWTTLLYLLIMLPLGIIYFTVGVTALAIGLRLALAPLVVLTRDFGWFSPGVSLDMLQIDGWHAASAHTLLGSLFYMVFGIAIVTALMHVARGVARVHARLAKALLVKPGASG